jgi:hypothetical protein
MVVFYLCSVKMRFVCNSTQKVLITAERIRMTVPVFEEYEPAADCDCPGCVQQRRALAAGGHPASRGCRRALVAFTAAFTAAGVALGSGAASAAEPPALPGGPPGPAGSAGPAVAAGGERVARPDAAAARGSAAGGGAVADGGEPVGADRVARRDGGARADAADTGAGVRVEAGDDPEGGTEQGGREPLHGRPLGGSSGEPAASTGAAPVKISRAEIINRAKRWVSARVPYSMERYWSDGYRQDCSGFVSMAWKLTGNEWTGSLATFGTRILRDELQPGDILLFHNLSNPTKGSHVTIFGGWIDYTHTYYLAYEQAPPHARSQVTPMAYWNNSAGYVAYRRKGVSTTSTADTAGGDTTTADVASGDTTGGDAASTVTPYPGAGSFGPGVSNTYVTQLGQMLVERGGKRFYPQGPGPRWSEAHRRATQAFQRAQGWTGVAADGFPGPETWRRLVTKQGTNIPAAGASGPGRTSAAAPTYPGRGYFRPGTSNAYVAQLGRQLVKRGYGKHYTSGPGPRWSEAHRRSVEAFQRAQGWRGAAANGFPGPETWRRLFA